ncbi:MAG: zinc-ribbon domain-containing protein [Prevotella sp.]|nr:zinc-ribbon domain-containing protein [Prevotella sp.]
MSLIKCDDCGSDISDSSLFCPHCGRPTHLNKAYPHPGEVPEAYTKLAEAVGSKKDVSDASDVSDATDVDEDGAERARRRNERLKVALFLAVFVVILGLVLWVYFFMPRPEQEDELLEATEEITIVEDSASAATPDTAPAAPAAPTTPKPGIIAPKAAPAAAPAPKAERAAGEVTMKSLQEQAAHPAEAPAAESPASPAESTVP